MMGGFVNEWTSGGRLGGRGSSGQADRLSLSGLAASRNEGGEPPGITPHINILKMTSHQGLYFIPLYVLLVPLWIYAEI
jgi:hypothetical protein